MAPRYVFTIDRDYLTARGDGAVLRRKYWYKLHEAIGVPTSRDLGKRVYEITRADGTSFFQVENDEQMRDRLQREERNRAKHTRIDPGTGCEKPLENKDWPDNS